MAAAQPIDRARLEALLASELERFQERTKRSLEVSRRAIETMPGGVGSGVAMADPYPLVIERASGARIHDVDANEYVDYCNGFSATPFGHAHPQIVAALVAQASRGTHFGATTEIAIEWAEEITERFDLDWVRFTCSGTEATMDCLRLARAHTGRELVIKIEGAYHGEHPEALTSTNMDLDESAGPDDAPFSRPFGAGVHPAITGAVRVVPFNDLGAAERALSDRKVAALIVEPVLFNVGAIWPAEGYLGGLRELCDRYGTVLVFDEVKTAITIAHGGAEELFGVRPDLKALGKGIGGGLPSGAIGGADDWGYRLIESWEVPQLSTFAANPLSAAAGLVALRDVLGAGAYEGLEAHRQALVAGLEDVIAEHSLPAYVIGAAAKNCIVWVDPADGRLRDFRDYSRRFDGDVASLAWYWLVNRGVLLAPGHDEQTTHSVAHGEAEADQLVGAIGELAAALRA